MEESYDAAVTEYFQPYHHFVDKLLRFGFNHDRVADQVIACSKCLCCPAIICVKHNNNNKETSMSFAIVVLPVVLFTLRNGLL